MDLDELIISLFIISMFVLIDDELHIAKQRLYVSRLRLRRPKPKLADAEVLTMECVGEILGIDSDKHLLTYLAPIGATSFPRWRRPTERPLCVKRPNGKDHSGRQTFYGFRLHARITWPAFITEFFLAPANQSEQSITLPLVQSAPMDCPILGDRNYCIPEIKAKLAANQQYRLTPPARHAKRDPDTAQGKK
ncbi:hypothetical protein CCAX7_62250 [Capsulimonas corticalis]|uniref:Uncharacterized protein n=1 Tax=Capsulimonas corticalis TaxID=2219043 RepID=A0A402CWI4_9BACT|nr:hypothetical protein [Capsulimonas corticalis]BDI34174.1 hypothetical protein CCAX7_62250 [Capsulimonas corticalis]